MVTFQSYKRFVHDHKMYLTLKKDIMLSDIYISHIKNLRFTVFRIFLKIKRFCLMQMTQKNLFKRLDVKRFFNIKRKINNQQIFFFLITKIRSIYYIYILLFPKRQIESFILIFWFSSHF
jgi:hypothetical protein